MFHSPTSSSCSSPSWRRSFYSRSGARRHLTRQLGAGTAVVTLVARGVWWYGEGAVLGRLYSAPIEEYLFIGLQPLLVALWLAWCWPQSGTDAATRGTTTPAETWATADWWLRLLGVVAGLAVSVAGLALLSGTSTLYIGAILAWAGPVLAIQWGFGWWFLWHRRRLVALAVGGPTIYLAAIDRVAIELGIWTLSPAYTTGLTVLGLPIEEGAFFLVTSAFVVQGLVLFRWVVDAPSPATPSTPDPATP